MRAVRRALLGSAAAAALVVATAGAGLAHECTNLDKQAGAGAQLVFGPTGDVEYISKGLQNRIDPQLAGLAVIGLGLIAINLLSWHGTFWAIWPLMAFAVIGAIRWVMRS